MRESRTSGSERGKSRKGLTYLPNFFSYRIKISGGSHCGGKEDVAYATRRAGNLRLPGESRKRDSLFKVLASGCADCVPARRDAQTFDWFPKSVEKRTAFQMPRKAAGKEVI